IAPGPRLKRKRAQKRLEPERAQHAHRVGAHLNARAQAAKFARLLVDGERDAAPRQKSGERQSADPPADDGDPAAEPHPRPRPREPINDGGAERGREALGTLCGARPSPQTPSSGPSTTTISVRSGCCGAKAEWLASTQPATLTNWPVGPSAAA